MTTSTDGEMADLLARIRPRWRTVVACGLGGIALAALVLLLVSPRFPGRSLLLVQTAGSPLSLMGAELGVLGDLGGGALAKDGKLKTEVALLRSRSLLGEVVDSLRLQYRWGRVPVARLDALEQVPGRFPPRRVRVAGRSMRLVDREDAIDDLERRIHVEEVGGDVLAVDVDARDSLLAAAIPNLIAERYMDRRRIVDRGVNRDRVRFLARQADSVRLALGDAATRARLAQERSGILSLEASAPALEEARQLAETRITGLRGEAVALDSVLASIGAESGARLAGLPALTKSPALNALVTQLGELEIRRAELLARFTPSAPAVRALEAASDSLRRQIPPLAATYGRGLAEAIQVELGRLAELNRARAGAPRAIEAIQSALGEVEVLGKLLTAVSTQLLEARLLAIGEGGVVRIVDRAVAPRRARFPRPALTLLVGLLVGLGVGVFAVIGSPPRS